MTTMDDLTLAERAMAAARQAGAEAVDVLVSSAVSSSVGVADRALEEAERAEGRDVGIRVLIGNRQACVSAADDRDSTLRDMAERAVAMARAAPEDPWIGLADPSLVAGDADVSALDLEDPDDFPDPARLEEIALALEDAALSVEGVTQVEQASASWVRDRVTIVQSNGFSGSYRRSSIAIGASAIAGTGLGRERDYAYEFRRYHADLPGPEEIGRRAGRRAVERLEPRRPPSGRYPVLYDERVSGSLVGHLLSAANGLSIARGSSWLEGRMGSRVLPKGMDLIEDPTIPRGRVSKPFDAEGLPAVVRPVAVDGELVRWLLDLATARQLGLESTGNARRSVGGPPSPGASNIRMTEGPRSRDDLLSDMGEGLLVTAMIGASINPTTGAYSRGASGFWVEGGEIAYPVNEITIAGSLPEMLQSLVPANDADPAKAIAAPSLLVEGMTVGA